jgi:hypothetical protein
VVPTMVLGECNPESEPPGKEPTRPHSKEGRFGLLFWLFGFGFLLLIALWDMFAALWKSLASLFH